ncbi:MAG: hypothetical protein JNK67_30545 [Alphaproteobacteria bacterium]|nr:hypothetical protein [Alphaproteobacteria bacterium]
MPRRQGSTEPRPPNAGTNGPGAAPTQAPSVRDWIGPVAAIAILTGIWQLVALVIDDTPIVPGPLDVARALLALVGMDPRFLPYLARTLVAAVLGFAVAGAAAQLLGRLLRRSRATRLGGLTLAAVPVMGLIPVFIIWFGFGPDLTAFFAAALALAGMLARTTATPFDWHDGLPLGMALAFHGAIAADLVLHVGGSGYFLQEAIARLDFARAIAVVVAFAIASCGLTLLTAEVVDRFRARIDRDAG